MKKFLNGLFAILKVISWIWILLFTILMLTVSFTDGGYNLAPRIFAIIILDCIPVIFLIWRFKADKEIRLEKLQLKLEHKREEQAIKEEIAALERKNQEANYIKIDNSEKGKIITAIEPLVKSTLKAPLTAVMCTPEELVVLNKGNNIYQVIGCVHSQNSFGAMIKTQVKVNVKYENNEWQAVSGGARNTFAVPLVTYWIIGIIFTLSLSGISYFFITSVLKSLS